jgi:hypothetical protein
MKFRNFTSHRVLFCIMLYLTKPLVIAVFLKFRYCFNWANLKLGIYDKQNIPLFKLWEKQLHAQSKHGNMHENLTFSSPLISTLMWRRIAPDTADLSVRFSKLYHTSISPDNVRTCGYKTVWSDQICNIGEACHISTFCEQTHCVGYFAGDLMTILSM